MNKVTILGNDGAFSDNNTSYKINENILIDISDSIAKKLYKQDNIKNINNIFITHKHMDHIGGLESFVFMKLVLSNFKKIDLTIHIPRDAFCLISSMDIYYYKDLFDIKILDSDHTYYIDELSIKPVLMTHCAGRLLNYGFEISDIVTDKSIRITGDVDGPHTNNIPLFEYIFHDVGWTGYPIVPTKVHPTEDEILESIRNYGVESISKIIGIHTSSSLKVLRKAKVDEVFQF